MAAETRAVCQLIAINIGQVFYRVWCAKVVLGKTARDSLDKDQSYGLAPGREAEC